MLDAWTRKADGTTTTNSDHPLAERDGRQTSRIRVGNAVFGAGYPVIIAGPCSVESEEQISGTAESVRKSGAHMLRGGAFKPRTSPYSFQGLGIEGLELLNHAGRANGMAVVTEVLSEDHVGIIAEYADMLQVGARNMQNFALLKKLSRCGRPILLKRGPAATVKEWLMAAEYVLSGGNPDVVLCERGIRSYDPLMRNTLDLGSVSLLKELTHLPVIVDPSHATGRSSLVPAMARAGLAAGADGIIVEVHPHPSEALSDKAQQLTHTEFTQMMRSFREPLIRVSREVVVQAAG